jgi:hypothetical protein
MNSAQEKWYNLYIRPVNFTQADAIESLRIADGLMHGRQSTTL